MATEAAVVVRQPQQNKIGKLYKVAVWKPKCNCIDKTN